MEPDVNFFLKSSGVDVPTNNFGNLLTFPDGHEVEEKKLKENIGKCPIQLRPRELSAEIVIKPTSLFINLSGNAIGTPWTWAISKFQDAETDFDAIKCMEELSDVLNIYDSENLKCCKSDFSKVLKAKRADSWYVFTPEVELAINKLVVKYFNQSDLDCLPGGVLERTFRLLPMRDLVCLASVCQAWRQGCYSDWIWRELYILRFGTLPSSCKPVLLHSSSTGSPTKPDTFCLETTETLTRQRMLSSNSAKECFHQRIIDPLIGDEVEVSWKGKFRLDAQDVYDGQAWWAATIVDKQPISDSTHSCATPNNEADADAFGNSSPDLTSAACVFKYKIHYPGWDARWDEWVRRERLRWAQKHNPAEKICVNDYVEVWCTGASVPGAWLEAQVKQIKEAEYFVGKMLSSGPLWVNKNRVRLAPRSTLEHNASIERFKNKNRGKNANVPCSIM